MTFSDYYYTIKCSAEIAQLVEHFTRNEGVVGSSPIFSFFVKLHKNMKVVYNGSKNVNNSIFVDA